MERAKASDWKSAEEHAELLAELKASRIRPKEAIELLGLNDAGLRQVGVEKFLDGCDAASVEALFVALPAQPRHAVAFVSRLVPCMPEDAVSKALEKLIRDSVAGRSAWAGSSPWSPGVPAASGGCSAPWTRRPGRCA